MNSYNLKLYQLLHMQSMQLLLPKQIKPLQILFCKHYLITASYLILLIKEPMLQSNLQMLELKLLIWGHNLQIQFIFSGRREIYQQHCLALGWVWLCTRQLYQWNLLCLLCSKSFIHHKLSIYRDLLKKYL